MKRIPGPARWLALMICVFPTGIAAQEPLTLRPAIQLALKRNPDSDAAKAAAEEARESAALARTQYLPQASFTEDISQGNDPVYVFGTRLRQQRFTQADFALDSLNTPEPIGTLPPEFPADGFCSTRSGPRSRSTART